VKAARLSQELLSLPRTEADRIQALFEAAGLPTRVRMNQNRREKLMAAMKLDKKVKDGQINFVLARRIGKCEFGCAVTEQQLAGWLAQ
jgi:3-dehydroquinate synthetase